MLHQPAAVFIVDRDLSAILIVDDPRVVLRGLGVFPQEVPAVTVEVTAVVATHAGKYDEHTGAIRRC